MPGVLSSKVCVLFRSGGVLGTIWISFCYDATSSLSALLYSYLCPQHALFYGFVMALSLALKVCAIGSGRTRGDQRLQPIPTI
jgi:hypothetical protein